MDIKPQLSRFRFFTTLLALALSAVLILSCKSSSTDSGDTNTGGGSNGLTAHPSSVRLLPGLTTVVQISGSTRPDTILAASNGAIASATLNDTTVTIQSAGPVGGTSVKIGDHSTPQKTVTINITVATTPAAIILE